MYYAFPTHKKMNNYISSRSFVNRTVCFQKTADGSESLNTLEYYFLNFKITFLLFEEESHCVKYLSYKGKGHPITGHQGPRGGVVV
jgi:hypothetical protein